MSECPQCSGTGLIKSGFWIFSTAKNCRMCMGTGALIDLEYLEHTPITIDGEPKRMQEVFHVMAEARRKAEEAKVKNKEKFEVNRLLRKAQQALKEKDYAAALENAKAAERAASLL